MTHLQTLHSGSASHRRQPSLGQEGPQREAEFLRKERETILRDVATEKSRIRTIINSMGEGVLVCDKESFLVLINPQPTNARDSGDAPWENAFRRPLSPELTETIEKS